MQPLGALRRMAGQDKARTNAAAATARLAGQRRREQNEVDAYLAQRWRYADAVQAARDVGSRRSASQ